MVLGTKIAMLTYQQLYVQHQSAKCSC